MKYLSDDGTKCCSGRSFCERHGNSSIHARSKDAWEPIEGMDPWKKTEIIGPEKEPDP
jgi:hypothetical protein